MCDPISLAGLALSVGSAVANNAAANEAAAARSSALAAERWRQQGLESQQKKFSDESLEGLSDFSEDQGARAQTLADLYRGPTQTTEANADAGTVAPEGAASITVREMAKQAGAAKGRTDANAQRLANTRAFGDLLGQQMTGIQRNSSNIDQLTGFRRGSSDALTFELDSAAQQGAGKRFLGDLLGGAGALVGGYAAQAGAGNPIITNAIGRIGGDPLTRSLRGAGVPARNPSRWF